MQLKTLWVELFIDFNIGRNTRSELVIQYSEWNTPKAVPLPRVRQLAIAGSFSTALPRFILDRWTLLGTRHVLHGDLFKFILDRILWLNKLLTYLACALGHASHCWSEIKRPGAHILWSTASRNGTRDNANNWSERQIAYKWKL